MSPRYSFKIFLTGRSNLIVSLILASMIFSHSLIFFWYSYCEISSFENKNGFFQNCLADSIYVLWIKSLVSGIFIFIFPIIHTLRLSFIDPNTASYTFDNYFALILNWFYEKW